MKPKVSRDKEIHVATKIPKKEETLGKTHVATENLLATRIKGMGNNLSHDKETGSRQPNEEAAKNSVVTEDIRSQLHITKNNTKKVATSNSSQDRLSKLKISTQSQQDLLGHDLNSELGH